MNEIEIIEKRRVREKHFLQKNGEIVAKVYNDDVHFLKNGNYEEIDNAIEKNGNHYENNNNAYKVYFNSNPNQYLMKMETEEDYINIDLKNNKSIKIERNDNIVYKDILDGIDLEYQVMSTKVKENIILKDRLTAPSKLSFSVDTNLILNLNDDKSINAVKDGKIIFVINAPFMKDSSGTVNHNIYYDLKENDGIYSLDLILDYVWLKSIDTAYPVNVDPTISNYSQDNNVYDTYIFPGDTNINRNGQDKLKAGTEVIDGVNIINRTLLKFILPTIGTESQIIAASATLVGYPKLITSMLPETTKIMSVHELTSDWDETTANWETMYDKYNSKKETVFRARRSSYDVEGGTVTISNNNIDLTSIVKQWYIDKPNYGVMIKSYDESIIEDSLPEFFSKNNNASGYNPKPVLEVTYRNQNGLLSYLDYSSQNFTEGKAYVNNYNGNLTTIFDIGATIKGKLPATLKLVYNTNDVILNKNIGYGLGYDFSLQQTIREFTIDSILYLEYKDEDGTKHYFAEQSGIFKDEDNLGMTITQSSTEYILKDKENNSIKFVKNDGVGYLSEICDVGGNKITVQYNTANLISKIIDASNSEINLSYDINKITIISPSRTVYLNYINDQVSNIENDLGITTFSYESNVLKAITDSNNKKISYDYYEQLPYKVKKVTEYSILGDEGSSFSLVYNFGSTTIIDSKNRFTTKVFNYKGQVLSTSNLKTGETISDAYGKFSKYGEYNQYKDKLMVSDIPIRYVNNLLKNTSFEEADIDFVCDTDISLSYSDEYSLSGLKSMKLISNINNKSVTQEMLLAKGKYYTFSAYMKSNSTLKTSLSYVDVDNNIIKEESDKVYSNEEFYRSDVTIFYPEDATSSLIIKITLEESGIAYVDDVQLEVGETANNYNVLENSDFAEGLSDWTLGARSFLTGDVIDPSSYFETILLEDGISYSLKVKMNPSVMTAFSKQFNIGGKAGDSHKISFWFKNQGVHSDFLLEPNNVIISYHYIDQSNGHGIFPSNELNISEDNWQYFSYDFAAEKDYDNITLEFIQTFNANDLYITNLSLFKDIRSVSFDYDINGNVIKVNNLNNEQSQFSYDKNNQLTSMCDPKGKNFTFEYDNLVTDRVLNGISGTGISNTTKYDSFGNPINVRISSETIINEISDGLYKIKLKGNNKYLKNISNSLLFKINSSDKWYLEKIGDYYKIKHAIIDNKYLTIKNLNIVLDNYQGTSSQFELIRNNNGSYSFKSILDSNYIKNESDSLILASFVEDDYNFQFYFEKTNKKLFIENSAEYTEDGKYVKTTTDSNLSKITYDIDSETGLTKSVTNAKNQKTTYSYNSKEQITYVQNGNKKVNYTYNNKNMLEKIIQGNKEYNFIHDDFLNCKSIKIGDNVTLVTNNYEVNNGNLTSSVYGNNHSINYIYDDFDRVSSVVKMNNTYSYKYGSNGDLTKIISNNGVKRYNYDVSKRLHDYIYNDFRIKYNYDSNNNVIGKVYKLDNITHSIISELNDDDAIIKTTSENSDFNYNYDYLGRIVNRNINSLYDTNYEYITNGNRTTLLLKSITNNNDKLSYRYDNLNNITHIYRNDNLINMYFYDEYNELIRENNYSLNQTIRYKYDNSGNLLYKKAFKLNTYDLISEYKYEYTNADWEDQLTKFNDQLITYDNIGNPLTIGSDINLTWINGRELNSYNDLDNTITYNYDRDSVRTSKTVNNVETKYYLEGNKIIFEQKENNMLYYIYNDVDNLVGFKYNNDLYYYQKNAQEDIIGILDSSYSLVAKYEYDSWGSITSVVDANGNDISSNFSHIGNINPFRYRSYYYDVETRLYYLNSRYYNPNWGRFVNPDGIGGANNDILSQNLYAYVSNNPINNCDPIGTFLKKIFKKVANFISSIFDYSINKAYKNAPANTPKITNPIPSTATLKEKVVNNAITNIVANSKVSYETTVSVGKGKLTGSITYGSQIAPNSNINKSYLILEGGGTYGYGLPVWISGQAGIQLGIKSSLDLLNDNYAYYTYTGPKSGYGVRTNGGAGMYYSSDGTSSFSPGISVDALGSYTWVWDK